jgi:hypothetical protein
MNSRIVLLFLLVSLTLSVNALANNGKSYIVTDENTSSAAMDPEVVDPSIAIATPTYVHGETLNQFLSSGVFTIQIPLFTTVTWYLATPALLFS